MFLFHVGATYHLLFLVFAGATYQMFLFHAGAIYQIFLFHAGATAGLLAGLLGFSGAATSGPVLHPRSASLMLASLRKP